MGVNYFPGERRLNEAERRGFLYDEALDVLRQTIGHRAAAYEIRRVGMIFVARPIVGEGSYYVYATSLSSYHVGNWWENAGIRDGAVVRNPRQEDLPRPEPSPVASDRPIYIGDKVLSKVKYMTGTVTYMEIANGVVHLGHGKFKEPDWRDFWTHEDGTPIADVRKNKSTARPEGQLKTPGEGSRSTWARLLDEDD